MSESPLSESPLRLLLIDDNWEDRDDAKSALLKGSNRRFDFHEAETCAAGQLELEKLKDTPPHCIILDFDLPDRTATEFIQEMPRINGLTNIPVLVLTGSGHQKNTVVLRAGAQEYLGKSWLTPESLTRALENAIDRHATARQMAENVARLKASEEFSRTIIDNSPDRIEVLDTFGIVLKANQSGLNVMEWDSVDQIQGRKWIETWPATSQAEANRALTEAFGGTVARLSIFGPTAKNNPKWWDVILSPVADAHGKITQIISVARDVTATKAASKRLEIVKEASQVGFWFCDLPFNVLAWDSKVKEHFWLPPDAVVTIDTFYGRLHPEDRDRVRLAIQRSIELKEPYKIEYRTVSPTGQSKWIRATGRCIYNFKGEAIRFDGGTVDVSEIIRARETLEEHRDQLEELVSERTVKLKQTIGELESVSYSISHDMRQPLRSMQQFGQILLEDYGSHLDETGKSYLNRIITAASRLDKLIQDVLVYSRVSRTPLTPETIDLHQLVTDIVNQYPMFHPANAKITVRDRLLPVLATEAPLTQIISNLLGNAVKFVRPGEMPRVEVRTELRLGFIRLWIEDNGIGIAQEYTEKIWKMFERISIKDSYEGTGIGLSIVKKAAERMGGAAGVISAPAQGSRFWVDLPMPK